MADLKSYLDRICNDIPLCSDEVRVELSHHIEQAAAKLEAEGHAPEEALAIAIREFGDPAEIAAGLAEAHRRGGRVMFRRVIAPALIAVGVWLGAMLVESLWGLLDRAAMDSIYGAGRIAWVPPVIPRLDWAVVVGAFLAVHLCASRGGSRRECVAAGLSPLIVGGLAGLAFLLLVAGPASLGLGLGFVRAIGHVTLGTAVMVRAQLQGLLGVGFACLAATWLYFFAVRHMRERPFWLAAEESEPQAT